MISSLFTSSYKILPTPSKIQRFDEGTVLFYFYGMRSVFSYGTRLNVFSLALVAGLMLPPLALGYALGGFEMALAFLLLTFGLGLFRPKGRTPFPGTIFLPRSAAPGLYTLIESLAQRAGLKRMPEVDIVPGGQTNAAATLRGSTPVLIVTEALLDRFDVRRISAVLAHETAHLAHRDLVIFRLARVLQAATTILGFLTVGLAIFAVGVDPELSVFWTVVAACSPVYSRLLVAALSRAREFAADLGAARLTGDPQALADALERIDYQPRSWWEWVVGRMPISSDPAAAAFRSHPSTRERVRRLKSMAQQSLR